MAISEAEYKNRRSSASKRFGSKSTTTTTTANKYSKFSQFSARLPKISKPSIPFKHKIPSIRLRKPPQLIRWDFLIMFFSELWGYLTSLTLPRFLRTPIYRAWGYFFRCNLEESKYPIEEYPSLQEFFIRPLKDGLRPIEETLLTSPVDGKVMTCGPFEHRIEQVKGHSYTIDNFLGHTYHSKPIAEGKKLFQCVIYLAPGDYHRIHSPAEWTVHRRRHFPGTLLPVAPVVGKIIPQLLALNERVVVTGDWEEGFFSLTAVGAYNVGSIKMHFDDVRTNNVIKNYKCGNLQYFSWKGLGTHFHERSFDPISVEKGEEMGLFRLGSTVVLIFEAPENFQFAVGPQQKIKMGEQLGFVPSSRSETESS